jgi:hypothetical protein
MSDELRSVVIYNVIQLMPAEDWCAIYELEDKSVRCDAIDWIGLATVTEKYFRGRKEEGQCIHCNEVVGVEIDSDGCFGISNDCENFVRLMRRTEWEAKQVK